MPRNKVLEKAKVNVSASRSAVDLSQDRAQTALAGDIQMVYCQPFVKGSRGKINRKCFTRTAQVVSPAFHRITEHYDFFMVPLHALWRPWENWKLNLNDMQDTRIVPWNAQSNEVDLTLPANAPRLDFTMILHKLGVFASVNPQSPTPQTDIERQCRMGNDALRILDEARYGDDHDDAAYSSIPNVMSIFALGAYQKCYYEHYRNTAYESNNPYAYNFDWLTYEGTQGLLTPDYSDSSKAKHTKVAIDLFKRRRVNYRNDYFHNIYPALNYVLSSPQGANFSVPTNIGQIITGNPTISAGNAVAPSPTATVSTAGGSVAYVPTQLSVQNIRAAFALDKLMRAAAYAPKHVREQYKAQFGVDGKPYDDDMRSQRLGSFQSDVVLQEVTNMTQSNSADLGELGAKGVGASGEDKGISFYCEQDCLIVGLRYFMPRARYDNDGVHPWNIKIAREDFYQKAFENLGLRPFIYGNINSSLGSTRNNIIGWTVPNYEYKISPDLNMDCFKLRLKEINYSVQSGQPTAQDATTQSLLSTFVPHTSAPYSTQSAATAEYFKVAPEDLDMLFTNAVPADHRRTVYQFFSDIRIELPAVIPMSLHGQPSL